MDRFTISNPTCRTDLSIFVAHHAVEPTDHFRVVTETDTRILSQPDERLEVGTDSVALWHDEACTRIDFEAIELVEWHGDTIAQRDDDTSQTIPCDERCSEEAQSSNQMAASMEEGVRNLDDSEVEALKEGYKQIDD